MRQQTEQMGKIAMLLEPVPVVLGELGLVQQDRQAPIRRQLVRRAVVEARFNNTPQRGFDRRNRFVVGQEIKDQPPQFRTASEELFVVRLFDSAGRPTRSGCDAPHRGTQ